MMIGLMIMLALPQAPPLSATARYDLSCLEATAWQMASNPQTGDARNTLFSLHLYYLGRLSGRDDKTRWVSVAVADVKAKPRTDNQYLADIEDCMARLTAKLDASNP